jgi:Domain of unknown function (DUF932)
MTRPEYKSTLQQIVATKVPAQTNRYKPVSHAQLIDLTLGGIESSGFKLDKQIYTQAGDGQVANGRYTISNIADSEMQIQIGWQNSYNRQVSLKFAIGIHVFICANGMVNGDMGTFKRKHVGDIQEFTPQSITEYIKSAGESFREMQIQRELMKQVEITKRQQGELIGRMVVEEGFISSSEMNIIRKELQRPTHNYGAESSLWELYQHTTFSMKETHPVNWMSDHISAHSFFVNAYGELVAQQKPANIIVQEYRQLELSL